MKSNAADRSVSLSRGKKAFFWCLLLFMGTVGGLLIAEITVRVFDLKPESLRRKALLIDADDSSSVYFCYPSNPNGEFQPLPNVTRGEWKLYTFPATTNTLPLADLKKTPWCVAEHKSNQDLRDRQFPFQPPAGIVRIAMVGDSFVRGQGVPVGLTLPKQLERLLGTNRCEVMNVGFSGLATEHEVIAAQKAAGEPFNARHIVLVFIPNDIHLTEELAQRQRYINDLINVREELLAKNRERPWYEWSQLAQFASTIVRLRQVGRETAQWYLDSYDPKYNADGLQRLANDFKTLASMPNCRVAVVLYPLMYELEKGYPLMPIHERVKKIVQAAGLPVLDLAPVFVGTDARTLQVHPSDHHPNGRAHAMAARAIKEWLEKDLPEFIKEEKK